MGLWQHIDNLSEWFYEKYWACPLNSIRGRFYLRIARLVGKIANWFYYDF